MGCGHQRSLGQEAPIGSIPFFFFFFFCHFVFGATPVAYGGSQARGPIGAVATANATATAMPDLRQVCDLQHSSLQCWILNPLSKVRDQTLNLMVSSWIP